MTHNTHNSKNMADCLKKQIGGNHYKTMAMQPVELNEKGGLSFLAGCVIKRACRYDQPSGKGVEDLSKIMHEIELLLELRYGALVKIQDDLFFDNFEETQFLTFEGIHHEPVLERFLEKNDFGCTLRGHLIDCAFWADQLRLDGGNEDVRTEAVLIWSAAWLAAVDLRSILQSQQDEMPIKDVVS